MLHNIYKSLDYRPCVKCSYELVDKRPNLAVPNTTFEDHLCMKLFSMEKGHVSTNDARQFMHSCGIIARHFEAKTN